MPTQHSERIAWSTRPNYTARQLLTARQLNAGIEDELRRQRLLSRAIHGFGVVAGFGPVTGDDGGLRLRHGCLELTGGVALDRHGRILHWKGGHVGMDDIVGRRPKYAGEFTLYAHFACRPPLSDGCRLFSGDRAQWWLEGVVFTLRPGRHDVDRDCPEHPIGGCTSHGDYLCRRTGSRPDEDPYRVAVSEDVDWLLREPADLCPTDIDDWHYDPDHEVAVPIAGVSIGAVGGHDHQLGFLPAEPEICGVRPLVHRNPLLYELAGGCDVSLARVEAISWQPWIDAGWSAKVPWTDFKDAISAGLEIAFSRPVRAETLHAASVFLTAISQRGGPDYWAGRRVPTERPPRRGEHRGIEPLNVENGLAGGVRLTPTPNWIDDETGDDRSELAEGARFELTIRGQLLRDRCGEMLDARPIGIEGRAHGHARPGGDFVSAFQVGPRPEPGYDYRTTKEDS